MKNVKKLGTVLLTTAILTSSCPVYALSKDETVYSKLNSDGSVNKTVVSEYLKNSEDTINDKTDLKNILNLNGKETYKLDGTNLVWDAKGKDIYYQGETNKALPVDLSIEYKLDGKKIELNDLLGKKGKVEITLNYVNHDTHNVLVNGKYEVLYTPFVVTMGTVISNSNNSNITVSNGRVVSNGKSSVVVALASPGLADSLKTDKLKDFDKITISFDTKSFELSSIYSVVSSKLVNSDDLNVFHKFDSVYSKVDTLSNSSKKLVAGSNKLNEGAKLLNSALTSKIKELENSSSIDAAKLEYIKNTAGESAVKTVENEKTSIKEQGANAVDIYILTIKDLIKKAQEKNPALEILYDNNLCGMESSSVPAQYQPYLAYCQVADVQQYLVLKKTYAALQNEDVKALVKNVSSEVAYGTAKTTAKKTAEKTSEQVAIQVADTAKTTTLTSLKTLNANVEKLASGVNELSIGMNQFDEDGISKIASIVNGDVKTTQARLQALMNLGKAYDSFTMKDSNTESETKFVLMTNGAKKVVKNNNKKVKATKKETIIDKIKKIF
ncbi:MAG: hypothetical protein IJ715_05340 [Bacilli bacterium]|nr:hypothetical protein [Bacilli bacterium]